MWKIKLNDSVLHMITIEDEETNTQRIYCGLSDGSLALLEVY